VEVGHALIGSVTLSEPKPQSDLSSLPSPSSTTIPLRATPLHIMPLVGGLEERTFEHSTFMLYARDAKDVLQPNETQRNTLIVAGVYILVIGILWYAPSIAPLQRHLCGT